VGHEYAVDVKSLVASLLSLGLYQRAWEGRDVEPIRGVGVFDVTPFSPAAWKPNNASYTPFLTADRFDSYWGAKIVLAFTPAQLRAAVETGRFSDPRAVDYLTTTLIERQRALARYWFSKVAPIERPEVVLTARGYTVCFDDLAIEHHLVPGGATTRYTITTYDRAGARLATHASDASPSGRTCTQPLAFGTTHDAYTITEIRTRRPGLDASTYVHLANNGGIKVVGIFRQ